MTLHVAKHEYELALRLNSAVFNGDLYRVKRLVEAGINSNNKDYDGRSPLVLVPKLFFKENMIVILETFSFSMK